MDNSLLHAAIGSDLFNHLDLLNHGSFATAKENAIEKVKKQLHF